MRDDNDWAAVAEAFKETNDQRAVDWIMPLLKHEYNEGFADCLDCMDVLLAEILKVVNFTPEHNHRNAVIALQKTIEELRAESDAAQAQGKVELEGMKPDVATQH